MASHGIGETGLSDTVPSSHHGPYSLQHHGINSANSFIGHGSPAFDFGELEEAIILQGVKIRNDDQAKVQPVVGGTVSVAVAGSRAPHPPAATLDMFPAWPLRFHQNPRGSSKSAGESTDSGSAANTVISSKVEAPDSPSPVSVKMGTDSTAPSSQNQCGLKTSHDKRRGSNSDKQLDAKTLRRLAQNREAARKSRLRKKAYVQNLESSRIKLSQLEQDLQRARSQQEKSIMDSGLFFSHQGLFLGGCGGGAANISSGAAIFDMEYARWLEDDHRHMLELRTGLQAHLSDGDLRVIVDGYISHYDEIFRLKGSAAKSDVFHLITGMWTTPAERCFLWMGGFRPSELIKMLITQLDPLTEPQLMGIYNLQQSSQQAEEALTQGLEQLQQSLVDTIADGSIIDGNGMQQMVIALGKLANLEGFLRQADNLRQQTLHQLRRILTVKQAARCFLVIGEYYGRLRALSSLWASRPRENMVNDDNSCQTTDLQMVQHPHNHFSNF